MVYSTQALLADVAAHWFCLRAAVRREHLAASALAVASGVETFAPRVRYRKGTQRGAVWFQEAMFPGYFFVRMVYGESFRQVQAAPSVKSLVRFGEGVAVLSDEHIAQLQSAVGEDQTLTFAPDLKVGDTVSVAGGALRGFEAVITQLLPGHERVRILVDFLGRTVQAEARRPELITAQPGRGKPK